MFKILKIARQLFKLSPLPLRALGRFHDLAGLLLQHNGFKIARRVFLFLANRQIILKSLLQPKLLSAHVGTYLIHEWPAKRLLVGA